MLSKKTVLPWTGDENIIRAKLGDQQITVSKKQIFYVDDTVDNGENGVILRNYSGQVKAIIKNDPKTVVVETIKAMKGLGLDKNTVLPKIIITNSYYKKNNIEDDTSFLLVVWLGKKDIAGTKIDGEYALVSPSFIINPKQLQRNREKSTPFKVEPRLFPYALYSKEALQKT